jgi:hypothetical protein
MAFPVINCLCGAIRFEYEATLPVHTELCHCNPCRHTTGGLFSGFGRLKAAPDASILAKCTAYESSPTHTRYFCSTCGGKAFIYVHHWPDGKPRNDSEVWCVIAGAIDPPAGNKDVMFVDFNMWLADAADGGLAPYMTKLGGRDVACSHTKDGDVDVDTVLKKAKETSVAHDVDAELKAECRCGGVSFSIQRANHADSAKSPLDRFRPRNADGEIQKEKHYAATCVCRSCRLHQGVSLATWIYVPPQMIINPHTERPLAQYHANTSKAAADEANAGQSLGHYWSSELCCRSFCRICGAAVFYNADDRPEITNIAAGILRADEGILARSSLSWAWGKTSCEEEATDREITEAWLAIRE